MRSQSLFNFFTKAADVTQTAAGTRIHTGASATAVSSVSSTLASSTASSAAFSASAGLSAKKVSGVSMVLSRQKFDFVKQPNFQNCREAKYIYESVNKTLVPYKIAPRRDGDIAECYADPEYAYRKLGFKCNKYHQYSDP